MRTNNPTDAIQLSLPFDEPKRKPKNANDARRPDGGPLQIGEHIICDRPPDVFCACVCGEELFTVKRLEPHFAQLVCDNCGLGRWLGREYFQPSNLKAPISND